MSQLIRWILRSTRTCFLRIFGYLHQMNYREIITVEPGKRGGRPCVRGMRITVGDVLGWLAAGMSMAEIIEDFPELTETDILACLAFAADKEEGRELTVTNA